MIKEVHGYIYDVNAVELSGFKALLSEKNTKLYHKLKLCDSSHILRRSTDSLNVMHLDVLFNVVKYF